jgi:hypothetical protein
MGDDTISDIDGFNRWVSYMQGIAQRQQARDFAETYKIGVGTAYKLLARCQWSERKAARMLKGKANG